MDVPDRSRRELAAARLLASAGFHAQAVSRAYFAAFFAAEEALLALGETRSKHSGVVSTFGRLVVREGGFEEPAGLLLRSLFERRNQADYVPVEVPDEEADRAINDAERFVDAVQVWLRSHSVMPVPPTA
ncbi:MAG: HEPN domain-containing protein [Actinobacteria bacterium]|nr:HEPN domain-containing protein [Actinomycetota bacterium]